MTARKAWTTTRITVTVIARRADEYGQEWVQTAVTGTGPDTPVHAVIPQQRDHETETEAGRVHP